MRPLLNFFKPCHSFARIELFVLLSIRVQTYRYRFLATLNIHNKGWNTLEGFQEFFDQITKATK